MEVTLSLPARGFVPGENLLPVVQVHNASNVNINQVYLSLVKIVTFRGKKQRKETKEEIINLPLGSVRENDHQIWPKSIITIPESASSQLKYCNIIEIQYYVQVVLSPSGMHCNTELNVPIVMGTIPFTHRVI
ncbi:hypothetical protein B566_EDAN002017 [Ephemera danica]|nr:hypothetical protein B566_EDAN002017 [Ephemera danica]